MVSTVKVNSKGFEGVNSDWPACQTNQCLGIWGAPQIGATNESTSNNKHVRKINHLVSSALAKIGGKMNRKTSRWHRPAPAKPGGGGGGIVADSLECTDMLKLRPFQRKFLAQALAPDIDTAALSIPRGNGKSALAGDLVARILDPGDKLFRPGTESVLCAASLKQARIVYRFARDELEPRGGYTFVDSANRISITHTATRTRLDLIGSNGKTAMGLVNCPWAICDEPGAWEVNGGTLLYDAIETAKGKPGSPLKAVYHWDACAEHGRMVARSCA